jgi:hypothetical protein
LADIQEKIIKIGKRNAASKFLHAKNDKEAIASWRQDLDRLLNIFNVSTSDKFWFGFADSQIPDQAGNQYSHTGRGYPAGTRECSALGKCDFCLLFTNKRILTAP